MVQLIDEEIFMQLLEIDYEFAKGIIQDFLEQADQVSGDMDSLLQKRDWVQVGNLGHHLKGSSAAVGAAVIRDLCDEIQHYETATKGRDPGVYLKRKALALKRAIPEARTALETRLQQVSADA